MRVGVHEGTELRLYGMPDFVGFGEGAGGKEGNGLVELLSWDTDLPVLGVSATYYRNTVGTIVDKRFDSYNAARNTVVIQNADNIERLIDSTTTMNIAWCAEVHHGSNSDVLWCLWGVSFHGRCNAGLDCVRIHHFRRFLRLHLVIAVLSAEGRSRNVRVWGGNKRECPAT